MVLKNVLYAVAYYVLGQVYSGIFMDVRIIQNVIIQKIYH